MTVSDLQDYSAVTSLFKRNNFHTVVVKPLKQLTGVQLTACRAVPLRYLSLLFVFSSFHYFFLFCFDSLQQIKSATHQLFGARKYSFWYRRESLNVMHRYPCTHRDCRKADCHCTRSFIMVALWNRADHYIFILWFVPFFFFWVRGEHPLESSRLRNLRQKMSRES